jgi:hypothetical protein
VDESETLPSGEHFIRIISEENDQEDMAQEDFVFPIDEGLLFSKVKHKTITAYCWRGEAEESDTIYLFKLGMEEKTGKLMEEVVYSLLFERINERKPENSEEFQNLSE